MDHYYVDKNTKSTGEHEVHKINCFKLLEVSNLIYLGFFSNCADAIKEAEKYFKDVDACYYCCKHCNKS